MTAAGYAPRARVLCVDDEPNVLAALSRTLQPFHDVVTATGAAAAIARLERGEAFHVVVSDLKMPEMDGVAFFGRVRQLSPDSVRVLLTGNADLSGAIAAVNEGQVFRFLVKPCASDALLRALAAAVEQQHRVIGAVLDLPCSGGGTRQPLVASVDVVPVQDLQCCQRLPVLPYLDHRWCGVLSFATAPSGPDAQQAPSVAQWMPS